MKENNAVALFTLLIIFLLFLVSVEKPPDAELPTCPGCNVLILAVDVFRGSHMGLAGYFRNTTPNMDAFASKSIYFRNAFSPSSLTFESHVSLLSGKSPSEHLSRYYWDGATEVSSLNSTLAYLPKLFQNNGYATAGFFYPGSELCLNATGFQTFAGSYNLSKENYLKTAGKEALSFMGKNAGNGTPSFVFLHDWELHEPYLGKGENFFDWNYSGIVDNLTLKWEDAGVQLNGRGEVIYAESVPPYRNILLSERDVAHIVAHYDGLLRETDSKVGNFLSEMEGLGLMNDTIIVLVSEHGENLGEGGWFGHGSTDESNYDIPLAIFVPGQKPAIVNGLVSSLDIYDTLLALTGTGASGGGANLLDEREWNNSLITYESVIPFGTFADYTKILQSEKYGRIGAVLVRQKYKYLSFFEPAQNCLNARAQAPLSESANKSSEEPKSFGVFIFGRYFRFKIPTIKVDEFLDWEREESCKRELMKEFDGVYGKSGSWQTI